MDSTPKIVILNGVGSVGKGSIAKALQAIATLPLLHVEMDAFLDMLPERFHNHPDGLTFETATATEGLPTVAVRTGPVAERALRGMRQAVAALAAQGNNLIVDEVMLGGEAADYTALLSGYEIFFVGVVAPLEVLEERERRRGDREIGLARWQFERVHRDIAYDLEVDTSRATALACAEKIKAAFGL